MVKKGESSSNKTAAAAKPQTTTTNATGNKLSIDAIKRTFGITDQAKLDMINKYVVNQEGFHADVPKLQAKTLPELHKILESYKDKGNKAFADGKYGLATSYYYMGRLQFEFAIQSNNSMWAMDQTSLKIVSAIMSNLSLTSYKAGHLEKSLEAACIAIGVDRTNVKAYYRKGFALQCLGKNDEAQNTLIEGLRIGGESMSSMFRKEIAMGESRREQASRNRSHTLARAARDRQYDAFPVKLVWDDEIGRKIIATRDIPKGLMVLRVAPYGAALIDECVKTHCGSCFRNIKYCKFVECRTCNMNVLCESCNKDKMIVAMHKEECDLLKFLAESYPDAQTRDFRFMLRVILKSLAEKQNRSSPDLCPQTWKTQPFIYDTYKDLTHLTTDTSRIDDKQMESFRTACTSIMHTFRLVKGNEFLKDLKESEILDLYPKILHNAHEYIDPLHHDEVARDITKNKSVRQKHLLENYSFVCKCARCDTSYNGFKCMQCGELLNDTCIQIRDPVGSFDGNVYECSRSHHSPELLYEAMMETVKPDCSDMLIEQLERLFDRSHLLFSTYYKHQVDKHAANGNHAVIEGLTNKLWHTYDATFGNPHDVIPFAYVSDCHWLYKSLQELNKQAKNDRQKKSSAIISMIETRQVVRRNLQFLIDLCNHHCLQEFEELFDQEAPEFYGQY
eukprot:gene9815-11465_t